MIRRLSPHLSIGISLWFLLWSLVVATAFRPQLVATLHWNFYPVAVLAFTLFLSARTRIPLNRASALIALFGAIALVSTPVLEKGSQTLWLSTLGTFVPILFFLEILPRLIDLTHYRTLLKALIGVITLFSIACFAIYFFRVDRIGDVTLPFVGYRPENFTRYCLYVGRNSAGEIAQWIPATALLLLAEEKTKLGRSFLIVAAVIAAVHVMITLSRGAQLVLAISLLPLILAGVKSRAARLELLLCIAALFSLILAFIPFAREKYLTLAYLPTHRLAGWETAIRHTFETAPFFGVGLYQFWPRGTNPHNSFVAILLAHGILGLLAFAGILVTALSRLNPVFLPLVAALLAGACFEDSLAFPLRLPQLIFWCLLGFFGKWSEETRSNPRSS